MYICSVSFYTSFGPNLTVPVPPDYFLVASPTASVSRWIWVFSWSKSDLPPYTSCSLVQYSPWSGWAKVYCGCTAIGSCQNQNSLIKKLIMLQSTLHYSFKVLCEHYLINHHNSSGEDKHYWLSYLDHILKELFFYVIVWLCYEIWVVIFIYRLFGYNLICWCKNFPGSVKWFLFLF